MKKTLSGKLAVAVLAAAMSMSCVAPAVSNVAAAETASVQKSKDQLKQELDTAIANYNQAADAEEKLDDECNALRKKLDTIVEQTTKLNEQSDQMVDEYEKLTEQIENAASQAELDALQAKADALEQKVGDYQKQIEALENEVDPTLEDLDAKGYKLLDVSTTKIELAIKVVEARRALYPSLTKEEQAAELAQVKAEQEFVADYVKNAQEDYELEKKDADHYSPEKLADAAAKKAAAEKALNDVESREDATKSEYEAAQKAFDEASSVYDELVFCKQSADNLPRLLKFLNLLKDYKKNVDDAVAEFQKIAEKPEEKLEVVHAMYRLYNPNSGEHFYTRNELERNHLVKLGWKAEGIGWYAPSKSDTPVYRLYNKNAGDHHYTTNVKEKDHLVKLGWNDEGIGWYSASEKNGEAVYRTYNPNAKAGAHHFTVSKTENNYLVKLGWKAEGIAWYGAKEGLLLESQK